MNRAEIPYFEDQNAKLVPGQPAVERDTINAILYNPGADEVLCLGWPKLKVKTFIIGGIERGEDPVAAAQREIREETGYKNLKFIAEVGRTKSAFYAAHKNENRISNNVGLLFELVNNERDAVSDAESINHDAKWIARNQVEIFIDVDSQKFIWRKAREILNQARP